MKNDLLLKAYNFLNDGKKIALVTNTRINGSIPGKIGEMMIVLENGEIHGTLGGGKYESLVIEKSQECLQKNESSDYEYNLTPNGIGMACGGHVKGYINVMFPKPKLLIVGGGHVGKILYEISKNLEFQISVVDDREEFSSEERFKDAYRVYNSRLKEAIESDDIRIDGNTYVVIVTRSHAEDKLALREVINSNAKYIGVIGSKRKLITLKTEFENEGFEDPLKNIYAPVGIDIGNNSVEEVAMEIICEILAVKNNGTCKHRKGV